MTERIPRDLIAHQAIVHAEAALPFAHTVDRTFELPTGLYAATAALFLGFVALMALGFGNPHMIVPLGIIVIFLAMFFAVPAQWVRMNPVTSQRATSWARFQREGVMTPFGRATAGQATAQVLILPAVVFGWGIAVVTIAALVR
ncbi:MAG: hypothetical protein ABIT09_13430 [Croceibacterium sp.]